MVRSTENESERIAMGKWERTEQGLVLIWEEEECVTWQTQESSKPKSAVLPYLCTANFEWGEDTRIPHILALWFMIYADFLIFLLD